jgi:hypothetical protein
MEKYGFAYIWFDRKHKRYYIGSHWGTENDGYVCSSSWMMQAYKLRPEDFKRRILSRIYEGKKNLLEEEYKWLSLISDEEISSKKYYNRTKHKNGHWMAEDYEKDVRKRISQKTKEAMQRPDVREKYLEGLKTRDCRSSDLEVREKRRQSMMGKNVGKDNSKAVKAAAEKKRGTNISEEHKNKIKNAGVFKTLNSKSITCIHCGVQGNPGNIGRYHNDKCNRKQLGYIL